MQAFSLEAASHLVDKGNQLYDEQENQHVFEEQENLTPVWEILFALQEISFEVAKGASYQETLLLDVLAYPCQHLVQRHQILEHLSLMRWQQP